MAKNLPAMQETQGQSLGWEDPLEKKWQRTPVSLSGEFHGQRSLADYSLWGHKESDITERLTHTHIYKIGKLQGPTYSTGNYIQYPVIIYNVKESEKHICITIILLYT